MSVTEFVETPVVTMSVSRTHVPIVAAAAATTAHSHPIGDALKEKGNQLFMASAYEEALALYEEAIKACGTIASYHANASACCSHLGEYGQAAIFANEAIRLDPSFTKAYYRRAVAMIGLKEWKAALEDLRLVVRSSTSQPAGGKPGEEISSRITLCERELQKIAFARAIHVDVFTLDPEHIMTLEVSETYEGPRLGDNESITVSWVKQLIEWFREERKLHPRYAYRILYEAKIVLDSAPNVVSLPVPDQDKVITVCGDIHGQFFDLLHIFKLNGFPSSQHSYLFNGDLVDRGAYSLEVLLVMLALKVALPNNFFIARGNHEVASLNRVHGFYEEVTRKYSSEERFFTLANEVLNMLPLAHVIGESYFVVHGGLPEEAAHTLTIEQIQTLDRKRDPESDSIMGHLLWSDPQEEAGLRPNDTRGAGILFGPDVTEAFLKRNRLSKIIRSHVWEPTGYRLHHEGRCVTIFSAPNYTGTVSQAALINITGRDLVMNFVQYDAAPFRGKLAPKPRPMMPFAQF